jgi:RNA polymerase-binding protein DksA
MPKLKKKKPASKPSTVVRTKPLLKKRLEKIKAKKTLLRPTTRPAKVTKTNGSAKAEEPVVKAGPPKPLTLEMKGIRVRLMQMLVDLRKDIDHEVRVGSERDLAHINDTSDMASDSAEGDLALRIAESETVEAGEIERAIEKIDNGTYGTCEVCNKAINAERLQFLPFATLCIKCQELAEIRKREEGDELDDLAEGSDDSENN